MIIPELELTDFFLKLGLLFVLHSVALLWPNEWEVINRLFIVDQPISIHCLKQTTPNGCTTQYTTQPGKISLSQFKAIFKISAFQARGS